MQLGFWLIGFVIPGAPNPSSNSFRYVWLVTTVGGLMVALVVRRLGAPSSMERVLDEIHTEGKINYRKIPAMLVTSLISLAVGSSLGPETPVVDISGGVGSWLGEKLNLATKELRILTFCGMGAGLGAFFGSPVGSAFFALEFPHRLGLEYYEALIPTIVSSILGFIVFRVATGLTIGGEYDFPSYPALHHLDLLYAVLLGVIGAIVGGLVILIFRSTGYFLRSLTNYPIFLNMLGGLVSGLIAMVLPLTLFFGEPQIQVIINEGSKLGAGILLLTALGKIIAFSVGMQSGFRGGYVFVLFFIGAAVGEAISLLIPVISPAVAIISMMSSVTIAVVKTPISIMLITAALSHTDLIPVVAISGIISFLLTTPIGLLSTQQSRQEDG